MVISYEPTLKTTNQPILYILIVALVFLKFIILLGYYNFQMIFFFNTHENNYL